LTATQLNESFINDRNELLNNETNNFEDNSTHFTPFTIKEFSIPQIDENSIIQTVEKLPNKATGSDGILAKFVKQFITAVQHSIIKFDIFDESFDKYPRLPNRMENSSRFGSS
jgi:hypothetical protein